MRYYDTGATRDSEGDKLDYEGFLSPRVLKRFAEYMHEHRKQADGELRDSDNWQKGIPLDDYMKSMWRHFIDVWQIHRGLDPGVDIDVALCAVLFNIQGYLDEYLKNVESGKFIPMSSLVDITGRNEFLVHSNYITDPAVSGFHTHPVAPKGDCGWAVGIHHRDVLAHDGFNLHMHDGPVNDFQHYVTYYLLPGEKPTVRLDALHYDEGLGAYAQFADIPTDGFEE